MLEVPSGSAPPLGSKELKVDQGDANGTPALMLKAPSGNNQLQASRWLEAARALTSCCVGLQASPTAKQQQQAVLAARLGPECLVAGSPVKKYTLQRAWVQAGLHSAERRGCAQGSHPLDKTLAQVAAPCSMQEPPG